MTRRGRAGTDPHLCIRTETASIRCRTRTVFIRPSQGRLPSMNEWPGGWNDGSRDRYGSPRTHGARAAPGRRLRRGLRQTAWATTTATRTTTRATATVAVYGDRWRHDDYYATGRRAVAAGGVKITLISLVVIAAGRGRSARTSGPTPSCEREVDLSKVIDRPAAGEGTNYLIVGSDSREGLSDRGEEELHTGSAEGKRTDSMMILHVGSNGPTLISLPRDSASRYPSFTGSESGKDYPAHGQPTKLNAAYAQDGPELLVRTVEHNTGLQHRPLRGDRLRRLREDRGRGRRRGDRHPAGHQGQELRRRLQEGQADAGRRAGPRLRPHPVRLRGDSDLDRTKNQQKFLAALASQTATPVDGPQPVQALPDDGRGPGHADRRQGHEPVGPGVDVLRDEGRHGRRGQVA